MAVSYTPPVDDQQTGQQPPAGNQQGDQQEGDLILGKFKSQDDLVEAYKALEQKLGSGDQQEKTETDTEGEGEDSGEQAPLTETLTAVTERFAETGEITEDDYKALEGLGLSREMVDTYKAGASIQSPSEDVQKAVLTEIGGEAAFKEINEWAVENLSEDEVAKVNSGLKNADTLRYTLLGLRYMMEQAEGYDAAVRLEGKGGAGGSSRGYQSMAEYRQDLADERYAKDPAFRDAVKARLARSNKLRRG